MIGTVSALSMVGIPLEATVVRLVVADVGLVAIPVGMGGIDLALAVAMVLNPPLRAMDARIGPSHEFPAQKIGSVATPPRLLQCGPDIGREVGHGRSSRPQFRRTGPTNAFRV